MNKDRGLVRVQGPYFVSTDEEALTPKDKKYIIL